MSDNTLTALKILGIVILGLVAWKVVVGVTALVFKLAVPVLVIGGILYVVYRATGGKALGGGRRTLP
jgi:hypothetical protein